MPAAVLGTSTHTHAVGFPRLAGLEIIGKRISFAEGNLSRGRIRNLSHAALGPVLWQKRRRAWKEGTTLPIIHFSQTRLLKTEAKGLLRIVTTYVTSHLKSIFPITAFVLQSWDFFSLW